MYCACSTFHHNALDDQSEMPRLACLTTARTGNRVQAHWMGVAIFVDARRDHSDCLPLPIRKVLLSHIEDDLPDIGCGTTASEPGVLGDNANGRMIARVPIFTSQRCRIAPHHVPTDFGAIPRNIRRGDTDRRWQHIPTQLLLDAVRVIFDDPSPTVDGASRTWFDACHACITALCINHIISTVVRDSADGTRLLARIATNTKFRINQMLAKKIALHIHGFSGLRNH